MLVRSNKPQKHQSRASSTQHPKSIGRFVKPLGIPSRKHLQDFERTTERDQSESRQNNRTPVP